MVMEALAQVVDEPKLFAGCCLAISKPLLQALSSTLPCKPELILSVGCGSGLLEGLLIQHSNDTLELYGVEVPHCPCPFLPSDRVLRVPGSRSVHSEAILSSVLVFVYPRVASLIASYLEVCTGGALEKLVWLGHHSDWLDSEKLIHDSFVDVQIITNAGLPDHEIMVVATNPRQKTVENTDP